MDANVHEAKGQLSPELGSARGAFVLTEGWDAPLSDSEVEELFGG